MTMKMKAFVSLGFAAVAAGSAMAADLPVKGPLYKAPPPAFSWTGCYVGAHFGSLFAEDNWTSSGYALATIESTGILVGGQAGCNYQISNWVLGVQGDYAGTPANGTTTDQVLSSVTDEVKNKSLASVTGRVGYALDRWLPYVKAGGAWTKDSYNTYNTSTSATSSDASGTRNGWTAGGGLEYTIVSNLSIFIEYDWYDFGTKSVNFNTNVSGLPAAVDVKERDSVLKVGLNWTFR
jgi:outer membrane immunogenic protein